MTQRAAAFLTIVNLALLGTTLYRGVPLFAQGPPGMLRGSGLEIVDPQGRVRASITIYPEDAKPASGRAAYPEVVVFRLHDREGKPTVKIDTHEGGGTTAKGSAVGLLGDSDDTQALIGTEGATTRVRLKNRDGKEQLLTP